MPTKELEQALASAVRASLPLQDKQDRLAFIGKYLLAQHIGTALPVAESQVDIMEIRGKLKELLAELSLELTKVVNAARGKPGWPLKDRWR